MGDFRIADNLNANAAELQIGLTQTRLANATSQLASGLRIQSAADDPSGLAISQQLLARSRALATGSKNVALARDAAAVADGALATITSVLQRIRSLAVEASTSVTSDADRQNIQIEIDELTHEIDRISQNTTYNGQQLLDGSHSGFVPAQSAQLQITANSPLSTVSATAGTAQNNLVQSATFLLGAQQPTIWFSLKQNVTASANPQTVQVSDAQYIAPNTIFALNGGLVYVQSVDGNAGTITGVFTASGASGDIANPTVNGNATAAISAGQQLVTLTGSPQPLYAGEALQVDYGTFATNEVVVVQKVVSPNSFVADFSKAHASGVNFFSENGTFVSPGTVGSFTFSFGGTPTDSPQIGSIAYVMETSASGFPPPNGSQTQVVATGTVIDGSVSSETIYFPTPVPNYFGGSWEVMTNLGYGSTPLVNTDDGTIKLQVVNTGTSIAVQESFYDTATHATEVSPILLAPNEQSVLFDGVVVNLGNFTTNDVGQTSYIKVQQGTSAITAAGNTAFSVQSGGEEGDILQLGIPSVSSESLRVSTLNVLATAGGDPTLAAEDTIGQVDFALQRLLAIRANLGAFEVTLGTEGSNDDQASMQTQAAASTIADANIPAETAAYTLAQTDAQVGMMVLSQANLMPSEVLRLFR